MRSKQDVRFVAMVCSMRDGSTSTKAAVGSTPALLTSRSISPSPSRAWVMS